MQRLERTEPITLTNMCMIYDDDGNVLVEEKIVGDNKYLVFPGGHVEHHESITDSVIRELQEETGLTVSELEMCGVKDWVEEDGSRYMVFLYKTNKYTGKLQPSTEGNVFWMGLNNLRQLKPVMWHMDMMLEVFCQRYYTELFFNKTGFVRDPELK